MSAPTRTHFRHGLLRAVVKNTNGIPHPGDGLAGIVAALQAAGAATSDGGWLQSTDNGWRLLATWDRQQARYLRELAR